MNEKVNFKQYIMFRLHLNGWHNKDSVIIFKSFLKLHKNTFNTHFGENTNNKKMEDF